MKSRKPERVPTLGTGRWHLPTSHPARSAYAHPPGTIEWWEHEEAWKGYNRKFRTGQTAIGIANRGGFSWTELLEYLGHEPTTWRPRQNGD